MFGYKNLTAACCAATLAVGLAACGSSSDKDSASMGVDMNGDGPAGTPLTLAALEAGMVVEPGTYAISGDDEDAQSALLMALMDDIMVPEGGFAPGADAVTAGGYMFMCSANSAAPCTIAVGEDYSVVVTGTILVAAEDGMFPMHTVAQPRMAAFTVGETPIDGMLVAMAIGGGTPIVVDPADPILRPFIADGEGLTEGPEVTPTDMADDFAKIENTAITIPEWTGSVFRRSQMNGGVVTTVVSYTDIEDQAYSVYYSATAAPDRTGVASVDDAGVLTLDTAIAADLVPFKVDLTGLTAGTAVVSTTATPAVSQLGSFNGVPGTFACDSGCAFTPATDGSVGTVTGAWKFTPEGTVADLTVPAANSDEDYMNLAVWLVSTTAGGSTTYAIGTHAHSNDPDGDGDDGYGSLTTVVGTASYAGPATGIYMRKTLSPDGVATPAAAGQFLADATLTANFGGGDIGTNHQFRVSGVVDNFTDESGEAIRGGWSLALGGATAGVGAVMDQGAGTFGAGTGAEAGIARGTGPAGTWSGQFHGNPGTETPPAVPSSATGVFHGHFLNGHVAGAFGVRHMPATP